ncbi:hypothetical protein ACHHYP_15923 [Achlya hypogyna]|uniref:Transmembrane protein n=1 Tax=Achlya hypogyna TaxID=1202772 RepID=A0A1V9Y9U7_ACHHY|nr:hypothetical protein ACHHYP_15923 [Achlya hypogyna]
MSTAALKSLSSLRSIGQQTSFRDLKSNVAAKAAAAIPLKETTRMIPQVSSGGSVCANFVLFLLGLIAIAPFVLVPVFVCLKLDHDVTWSWATTLIPLWICNALVLPYLVAKNMAPVQLDSAVTEETPLVAGSENGKTMAEEAMESANCFVHTTRNLALIAYLTAQIFVVLRLDGVVTWQWLIVFIPYYVASILSCEGFDLIQALLIAAKMDGMLDASWSMVLMPSWIGLAVFLIFLPVQTYWAFKASPDDDETVEPKSRVFRFFIAFGLFLGLVFLSSPIFVAIYRLDYATFSTFYIALPFFVLVGIAILVSFASVFIMKSEPQTTTIYVTTADNEC